MRGNPNARFRASMTARAEAIAEHAIRMGTQALPDREAVLPSTYPVPGSQNEETPMRRLSVTFLTAALAASTSIFGCAGIEESDPGTEATSAALTSDLFNNPTGASR